MPKVKRREEARIFIETYEGEGVEEGKVRVDVWLRIGTDGSAMFLGFMPSHQMRLFSAELEDEEEAYDACRNAVGQMLRGVT
jgi:hypothetical protein